MLELDGYQIPLSDWHFGSDMARFQVLEGATFAQGWAVCVDLEKAKCEITYLIIIQDEIVGASIESLVKTINPIAADSTKVAGFAKALVELLEKSVGIPDGIGKDILRLLGLPKAVESLDKTEKESEKESEKEKENS